MHAHMHARMHAVTHTHTNKYTHIHTCKYTCKYVYTYTKLSYYLNGLPGMWFPLIVMCIRKHPYLKVVNDASYSPSPTSLIGFTCTCHIVLSNTATVICSLPLITNPLSLSLSVIVNVTSLLSVAIRCVTSHFLASGIYK